MTDNTNPTDNSNEELINLAYSMAVEPQRFHTLALMLDERIRAIQTSKNPEEQTAELNTVSTHFERAFELIERQGRRFNYATGSMRYIDSDTRPSALVFPNGQIFHANTAAQDSLGLYKDLDIKSAVFEPGHYERWRDDLKSIKDHGVDKIIGVYDLVTLDDRPIKMAMSRTVNYNGDPVARLCTFHVKWMPEMEAEFQNGFGLTPVELEITRAIVSGQSLNDLAQERGRAVATVRTQVKALLAKMGLRSQIELACIYSGFTQFNSKQAIHSPIVHPQENWRTSHNLTLPDGRNLHYETVGPKTGRPVLYFHGLIGGNVLTMAMRERLARQNINLIFVWRPSFANSTPDRKGRDGPERFAADIEFLLDHLGIDTCQILSMISGAIYAYAVASRLPNRVLGIVNVGGAIPITTKAQFSAMKSASRVSVYVARYTPGLLPMLMRAFLSKIDAGYDEEFVAEHYEESPHDLEVLYGSELKPLIRNSFPIITAQGYRCFVRDIRQQSRNWSKLLNRVICPVTLAHGEFDPSYPLDSVRLLASTRANFKVIPILGAGQLAMFRNPEVAFDALDDQYNARPIINDNVVPFPG